MYSQSNYKKDPVLLRLNSSTVSALYKANIKCLEELFSMRKHNIKNLKGIGKKRSQKIMDLLYNLPFDYMNESLPANPERDAYAGVNPALSEFLTGYYSNKFYKRGLNYYRRGKVGNIELKDEDSLTYKINIQGTRPYIVTLKLKSPKNKAHCTCPAFSQQHYGRNYCKHVYAAAMRLAEQQRLQLFENIDDSDFAYKKLKRRFKAVKSNSSPSTANGPPLDYYLVEEQGRWNVYPKKIYPVSYSSYNYNYQWDNPWNNLNAANPKDRLIVSYLEAIDRPNYGSSGQTQKTFGDVLHLLSDRDVYLKQGEREAQQIDFCKEPFKLLLDIDRTGNATADPDQTDTNGVTIQFLLVNDQLKKAANEVEVICLNPCWICYDTTLARVKGSDLARRLFLQTSLDSVQLPAEETGNFIREFYPQLQKSGVPIRMADELTEKKDIIPVPRLYLRERGKQFSVALRVAYNNHEIRRTGESTQLLLPTSPENNGRGALLWSVSRNIPQEESWIDTLKKNDLEATTRFRTFSPQGSPLEWVIESLPKLSENGFEIYGDEELKRFAPPRKMSSSSLTVRSQQQWFELEGEMRFGDQHVSMSDMHAVLIGDTPFIRLNDGSTGELTPKWLRRLKKLTFLMESEEETTQLPKMAAPAVEELGEAADEYHRDNTFAKYTERLQKFEEITSVDQPREFQGELRPYQSAGLSWMYFLHEYKFGGMLADDMGLGKTVQALALLQKVHEKSQTQPQVLIVAPRSVIHNWKAEARTFLPDYSIYIHHGPDRNSSPEQWPKASINITTYGTMRNDIHEISETSFDYLILDESHSIRNPSSKTFKAVRQLQGEHRLCLTGTPVQNTTMDLWSQFEFLNPGMLGNRKQFEEKWVKPLEKNKDSAAGEMLQDMVAPFILRRTKQKVADDLPPLTSSRVACAMDGDQQKIYEKYRQTYHRMVHDAIGDEELEQSKFMVLEGLLRLRQICCSPRLIEGETGRSAKLQQFRERVDELIREGHKALVFSQFTGFLRLIESEVQDMGWNYEYLDGQTRNRQERVDRFQSDASKKLFLISLKAGGEGLNLTAADYVFLMDPWWNPAAERQAMDRTHRIGQDDHVFVYRFVSPGTVEEKILRLQQRKRALAKKLIVAEEGVFKQLNRDDLLDLFE